MPSPNAARVATRHALRIADAWGKWKKSQPNVYVVYTSPSGKVRVQDTKRPGKTRYQVLYREGRDWLEAHDTGSLSDAKRMGLKTEQRVA